jgi:hypothetical protein
MYNIFYQYKLQFVYPQYTANWPVYSIANIHFDEKYPYFETNKKSKFLHFGS